MVGGGWINPLQTLSQGLVLTFDFSLLALSLTIKEEKQSSMVVSKYLVTSRLELECCRLVMTEVVIQHELVKMKVRKRLAWILFRRQRISLQND